MKYNKTYGNDVIAAYMGWFTEPHQEGSWFIKTDSAKYVIYSIHNNYPHKDLPFQRDWNAIMPVAKKVIESYHDRRTEIFQALNAVDIEALWDALVDFIEWYNRGEGWIEVNGYPIPKHFKTK
jgi:hypothetical protein